MTEPTAEDLATAPVITRLAALEQARAAYGLFAAYAAGHLEALAKEQTDPEDASRLERFSAQCVERGRDAMAALVTDGTLLAWPASGALAAYQAQIEEAAGLAWDDDEAMLFWVGEFPRTVAECLGHQDGPPIL